MLRPAAADLRNAASSDILVEAGQTTARIPFHTKIIRQISQRSKSAVVSIYVQTRTRKRVNLIPGIGIPVEVPGSALGSGFFIHPSGLIMTNDHVIDTADDIRILTHDSIGFRAVVVARDPVFDLALLKVQDPDRTFQALAMGNSEAIGVGEMVIAVGNPLGLGHTVTAGIISSTSRNLSGVSQEDARRISFLQIDAAINPGSSGGPLITLTGAWIGVNTAGIVGAQSIGFAVPSRQVREFLDAVQAGQGVPEAR